MPNLRPLLFALALLGAVAGAAWALWPVSDEDRVEAAVSEVVQGAREADLGAILGPISESYADAQGLTKDTLRGYLFRQFRSRGPIGVHRGPIAVEVTGQTATARFDALLVEGVEGAILPTNADAWSVTVDLRKEDGDWRITGHTRAPLEEGWRLPMPED